MRKIKNLYHKIIALVFVLLFIVVGVLAYLQDPAIRKKPETEHFILPIVQRGEFFSIGKYGKTLILEVHTEEAR